MGFRVIISIIVVIITSSSRGSGSGSGSGSTAAASTAASTSAAPVVSGRNPFIFPNRRRRAALLNTRVRDRRKVLILTVCAPLQSLYSPRHALQR